MKNTLLSLVLPGFVVSLIAMAVFVSVPDQALAQSYSQSYGGSGYYYGGGGGYSYGGGYSHHHTPPYLPPNPYPYTYPPAPSSYNVPTVQFVYSNGYYVNKLVPTARYFPPAYQYPQYPIYNPPVYSPPYRPNPPSCFGYGQGRYCY